jgi:hypothetical protein
MSVLSVLDGPVPPRCIVLIVVVSPSLGPTRPRKMALISLVPNVFSDFQQMTLDVLCTFVLHSMLEHHRSITRITNIARFQGRGM